MPDRDPFLLTPYDGGGGVFNRLRVSSFFITNTHSPAHTSLVLDMMMAGNEQ